ncbi:MAG: tetratricopeptide repeat protein [Chlorobi bacterium]|nr:tetratricopeptide repeat protein [Chlorobiota bacterium]
MRSIKIPRSAKILPFFLLLFVLPFLNGSSLIDRHLIIQFIGLQFVIILMIAAVLLSGKKQFSFPFSPVLIMYLLFASYSGVRLLSGDIYSDAIFDWIKIASYFLLFFMLVISFSRNSFVLGVAASLGLLGIVLAVWGAFELFSLVRNGLISIPLDTYQIKTVFSHRNIYCQALFLSLPFQIYNFSPAGKKSYKIIIMASIFLSIFMLIVLSNRTTSLALSIGFGSVVFLYFLKTRKTAFKLRFQLRSLIITTFISVVFSLAFFHFFTKTDEIQSHFASIVKLDKGSGKDRIGLWKRSLKLIGEKPLFGKPLFGIGPAKWKIEMLKFGNKGLVSENNITFYQRPHNDFLWISAEYGLIGGLVYLMIFILAFVGLLKLFRRETDYLAALWLLALLMTLIGLFVYSLFSFPHERIFSNIVLVCILAFIAASDSKGLRYFKGKIVLSIFFLFTIWFAYFGFRRFVSESHARKAILAKNDKKYDLVIKEVDRAVCFYYEMDPLSTPLYWYQGLAFYEEQQYLKAQSAFEKALELNPFHVHILNNLASACIKNNQLNTGMNYYREALSIYPDFEDARFNLTAVYFNLGQTDSAFIMLKTIDENTKDPRYQIFINALISKLIQDESIVETDGRIKNNLSKKNNWHVKKFMNAKTFGSLKNTIFEVHR